MAEINPTVAVPQAPRVLRAGTKGAARAAAAKAASLPAPAAMEDDDEEEEDEESPDSEREEEDEGKAKLAAKDSALDASAKASAAYAKALEACRGNDSAAAHLAAEDAGDAASAAHATFRASSMDLRGAAPPAAPGPDEKPNEKTPAPASPGGMARALVALAGTETKAQDALLADATLGKRMRTLFEGRTHEEIEGLVRAALADQADAVKLRATAAQVAAAEKKTAAEKAEEQLVSALRAAVRGRKYERAELFDVAEEAAVDESGAPIVVEKLTPKAWTRDMPLAALKAMIAAKQARAGGPPLRPEQTAVNISAAVRAYGEARGYSEAQIAALAASLPNAGASAPQEAP